MNIVTQKPRGLSQIRVYKMAYAKILFDYCFLAILQTLQIRLASSPAVSIQEGLVATCVLFPS